ncbi:hypothetical protein [Rhizobium sp. 11515TR]|uniref:hypothetical protein n=1 Tax=Rhizobium sp. 11515TR TaxID=2028343 RepID=UPI000BA88E7A|nr:hypothetical protein [Rhizobium sp. 11515TR]ASW06287.1 hypothetical protein CKA34_10595 [Rhizobium sp. 11515TR]
MTPHEIEELFIAAAHTDRRLPSNGERPAQLKAQALPYFHTQAEVFGWGAERYVEELRDFYTHKSTRLQSQEVSRWELCNELMTFVPRKRDRRCLWAWAAAEARSLRAVPTGQTEAQKMSFSRWCQDVEHIHRNTGARRKDAAVSCIAAIFLRKTLEDIRSLQNAMLQEPHKISDKCINIAEPRHWNDSDVVAQKEAIRAQRFDWVQWRNEQRRKADLRRRQAAA